MVKIAGGISAGVPPSWVNTVCDSSWQDAFWERAFGILTFPFDRGRRFIFFYFLRQYIQLRLGRRRSGKLFKTPKGRNNRAPKSHTIKDNHYVGFQYTAWHVWQHLVADNYAAVLWMHLYLFYDSTD